MRPSLTKAVLEHLAESGSLLISAFFPHSSAWSGFLPSTYPKKSDYLQKEINKHSLSSILWRLKKDGLVTSSGAKKTMTWSITTKGKRLLKENTPRTAETKIDVSPLPADNTLRLITFDIPEDKREQRDWLRTTLWACGFEPLHKSVFIGKRPVPEELIQEIEERRLGEYIHLVSIEKGGTIINRLRNDS